MLHGLFGGHCLSYAMRCSAVRSRTGLMFIGVLGMGVFLSFLLKTGYGTDTCSFMNASLSSRLGISLGTVMACSNIILFIPELLWGREHIGPGTVLNMLCIGYISDFCMMLERIAFFHRSCSPSIHIGKQSSSAHCYSSFYLYPSI